MSRSLARWFSRRSLRWRLTAGIVLLLVVTCSIVGAVTSFALQGFLIGRLDSQLAGASGRFSAFVEHDQQDEGRPPDGDADNAVPGQSVGTLGARLSHGRVTQAAVVLDNGRAQSLRLSAADQTTLSRVSSDGVARTVQLAGLGEYRVVAQPGRDGDVQVTGLPLSPVDDTVHRLLYVEFGLFAFVVLIGAAASTGLVRWNLRPLNRVTAAALAVSNLPLATGSVELPERSRASEPGTEVGRVSAALDHMLDHIEAALQARNATEERLRRFIADASHELRTPLATIRSHAEYAQRMSDGLPAEVRHALTRVESESVRMGLLVDDLLLLAQLDAGRPLAREPVDLTRLVLDGVGDARVASPDHRWRLDLPESAVEVPGDEHRLHQVITNLLANARTHTPPGTTVTITLRTTARSATVEIADDGPGIPADLLPDLFGRFTRADAARSRRDGNTGLGLAIVYGIVMAHRGHVDVESRGGSTVFRIDLPTSSRE